MEFLYFYDIRLNCGSTSIVVPEVLKAIKTVNYGIGAVEADLLGTRARAVPAQVARGWSVATDVWDLAVRKTHPFNLGQNIYPQERQQLYYLLRHCQVPVDILGEEDLINGRLADYRVYFLVGDHLSRRTAAALCECVKEGGTAIASAGGGLWDEYNEVNEEMLALFAIESAPMERADVTSPVGCSNSLVEAVLLRGNDQRHRICLLNFTFEPQPNLRVEIRDIPWRRAIDVATGKVLPRSNGAVSVALDEFRMLRLE